MRDGIVSYTRSLETGNNPPSPTNSAVSAAAMPPVNLVRPNNVLLPKEKWEMQRLMPYRVNASLIPLRWPSTPARPYEWQNAET